jgi:hypothetical protein
MGYKAVRNTYAIDKASGVETRRLVVAGDVFPYGYEPTETSDVEEVEGVGASPSGVIGEQNPPAEEEDAIAALKGDDLDNRAAELEIEGRSSMSADEKRDAIREAEANQ